MLISVIVPVYNTGKYLESCLKSIIAQDYKELEILLVDDGSTDSSADICKRFEKQDSRIRYILKEHSGLSATRNRGIKECQGEFFAFVDSDDTIHPNLISNVSALISDEIDVIAYGMESPDDGYELPDIYAGYRIFSDLKTRLDFIIKVLLSKKIFFSVCNKMYRKKLFEEYDLHPVSDVAIGEDLALNLQVFTYARGFCSTSSRYYQYWLHEESMMNKDKELVFYFNDFCNMMFYLKEKTVPSVYSHRQFARIYVKAMSNQYERREKRARSILYKDLKRIEKKDFFVKENIYVVLRPLLFVKTFERFNMVRRWIDHVVSIFS